MELPEHRQEKLIQACKDLFNKSIASIREVARVSGLIVASLSAVDYGKLHYRQLDSEKVQAWKTKKGNYNATMRVSESMKKEISWWIKNVKSQKLVISRGTPQIVICTDASLQGYEANLQDIKIGGR